MARTDLAGRIHDPFGDQPDVAMDDADIASADIAPAAIATTDAIATGAVVASETLDDKGVSYNAGSYGAYAANNMLPSIAAGNANAVAIGSEFGIDAVNSAVYTDDVAGGYSESDADVELAMSEATGVGLSVMLKPVIDFLPSNSQTGNGAANPMNGAYPAEFSRTAYNPASVSAFFASYQTMIVHEATLAQQQGASIFCIGCELDQLTGPAYLSYWTSIISAVRAVFSGSLTYAANWDDDISPWRSAGTGLAAGTGNLATQVSFWSLLDYVGIDEYAPISDLANPTLSQLIAGWTQTPTDSLTLSVTGQQSLISYYEGVAAAVGKKLLFTEVGYADATDAAINPGSPGHTQAGQPDGATADPTLQADLYQALFDAWQQNGDGALAGTYVWDVQPTGAGDPYGLPNTAASAVIASAYMACYAAGTRIATSHGACEVERLRPGDMVLTHGGEARPVMWLGHRHIRFAATADRLQPYPIRVRAHAFAPDQPRRDLVLSPDHAVFVDGVLIAIRHLVNGATVIREMPDAVTYWHVELASHDILLAEGLPAESYLDTGNRAAFANAPVSALHPCFELGPAGVWAEHACARLVEDGPILGEVRSRLAARAASLGRSVATTLDVTLAAVGETRVILPGAVEIVRLRSRASRVPGDGRRLGAMLTRLRVDAASVPLADPRLTDGFHAIETHGTAAARWTDGAATLALGPARRARRLHVEVAMLGAADEPIRAQSSLASRL